MSPANQAYQIGIVLTLLTLSKCHEGIHEGSCLSVPTAKHIDMSWLLSVPEWHFVLWSKLELYTVVADVTGQPITSISHDMATRGCFSSSMDPNGQGGTLKGYGGMKSAYYESTMNEDLSIHWQEKKDGKLVGLFANTNSTFTDNKTFLVGMSCWENGQRSFSVNSPTKQLPKDTLRLIKEYLKSVGFDPAYFVETTYDNCLNHDEL